MTVVPISWPPGVPAVSPSNTTGFKEARAAQIAAVAGKGRSRSPRCSRRRGRDRDIERSSARDDEATRGRRHAEAQREWSARAPELRRTARASACVFATSASRSRRATLRCAAMRRRLPRRGSARRRRMRGRQDAPSRIGASPVRRSRQHRRCSVAKDARGRGGGASTSRSPRHAGGEVATSAQALRRLGAARAGEADARRERRGTTTAGPSPTAGLAKRRRSRGAANAVAEMERHAALVRGPRARSARARRAAARDFGGGAPLAAFSSRAWRPRADAWRRLRSAAPRRRGQPHEAGRRSGARDVHRGVAGEFCRG